MQKYCNTLKFMWKELGHQTAEWISFEKCWKIQHLRFEQVLEHFVMFTKLLITF